MKVYRYPESQGEPDKNSPSEVRDEVDLSSPRTYYSSAHQQDIKNAYFHGVPNDKYRIRFDRCT